MRFWTALTTAILALSARAQGYLPPLQDLTPARNIAMGGAYEALGLGTEAITGNPAAMSVYPRYQMELSGAWDYGDKFAYGTLGLVDSASNRLAAGLSHQLSSLGQGPLRRTIQLSTAAFAWPFTESIHVGIGLKHLWMTGAAEANAITCDAGMVVHLFDAILLGAAGHNLIDTGHDELPKSFSFSAGVLLGLFSAAADLHTAFGSPFTYVLGGGAEYILADALPVRAGYSLDTATGRRYLSGGIGLMIEGGGLDIGYRYEISGPGRMIGLTLKLQP